MQMRGGKVTEGDVQQKREEVGLQNRADDVSRKFQSGMSHLATRGGRRRRRKSTWELKKWSLYANGFHCNC